LIVRWPGHISEEGTINHQPGHIIDIMATVCDIVEAEYPETYNNKSITPLVGQSFASLLEGESYPEHEAIFWEHQGNRAVREGNWKLVAMNEKPWELYDLSADRSEMLDLIESEQEIAQRLTGMYKEWAEKVGVR